MATKARGKTVEVDGIKVNVLVDPPTDYELIECSTIISDPSSSVFDRNKAYIRRGHIILGDDYDRVMGELRKAHGGKLESEVVLGFIARVSSEVAEVKN